MPDRLRELPQSPPLRPKAVLTGAPGSRTLLVVSATREQLKAFYDGEVAVRAVRPLGGDRERHVRAFVDECRRRGLEHVLEVGCGAGRDGVRIAGAGLGYRGLDLSPASVDHCRGLGLDATEGLATDLPFDDGSFDAGWTMSTLMHLDGDGMAGAVAELARVVRPGGMAEIGVWGHTTDGERVADDGRYFRHRTDEGLRLLLSDVGVVEDFATWDRSEDGHYQWARLKIFERPVDPEPPAATST